MFLVPVRSGGVLSARALLPLLLLPFFSCGGGSSGSGGGTFDTTATLIALEFLDPVGVNPEPTGTPPQSAPLNQQIRYTFSGRPNPAHVSSATLPVNDSRGFLVPGQYDVDGTVVTFTPRLPTEPVTETSPGVFDSGGAGLRPGEQYSVRVGPNVWSFVTDVALTLKTAFPDPTDSRGVVLAFRATQKVNLFFKGMRKVSPSIVSVTPADASVISPNLYSDPDQRFSAPQTFQFVLDAAVSPEFENLDLFGLVDVDDTSAQFPAGRPLGIEVSVLVNEWDRAVIEVAPSGILPFGNMVVLESPRNLRGLAQTPQSGPGTLVAASYLVESGAASTMRDRLVEDFDSTARREFDPNEFVVGELPADWDRNDSNVLQAAFGFEGQGELGRFAPAPPAPGTTRTLTLDTSRQVFPLFDGSTPEAPAGYTVVGGVFSFTTIDIPAGIIIKAVGGNPVVMTATGSVRIAGEVDLSAQPGGDENAFDSAVTSMPGGPPGSGGGRGGEGHPIVFWPPSQISLSNLSDPLRGGRGFGPDNQTRIGGFGGETGAYDNPDAHGNYGTDLESSCSEFTGHNNGWKVPGGGGGSMLLPGKDPAKHGTGNVIPNGQGGYIVRDPSFGSGWEQLLKGPGGAAVFADGDPDNDFIGVFGEHQSFFGGQGGGSGGSGMDSYQCGAWCRKDNDPSNDWCKQEFGFPSSFADSVGNSRGGGGGGGGGCFVVKSLSSITIESSARIDCSGARGGGGETLACSTYGGSGGGGAGGGIIFQSAVSIVVEASATLNVRGGSGWRASRDGQSCTGSTSKRPGAGGDGSIGIIQLQVPLNSTAQVDPAANLTDGAWVDQTNTRNPSEFGSESLALSTWFDMGRTLARPPAGTNPVFSFRGTDALSGQVLTDGAGNVVSPSDIHCDFLGQVDPLDPTTYLPGLEPRSNYIPPNATVHVHFQGANAIVEGSKEIDPATITPWTAIASDLSNMQFLRYRIRFDIAFGGGPLGPTTPRPAVQRIDINADF